MPPAALAMVFWSFATLAQAGLIPNGANSAGGASYSTGTESSAVLQSASLIPPFPPTPQMAHQKLVWSANLSVDAEPLGDHPDFIADSPGSDKWMALDGAIVPRWLGIQHADFYDLNLTTAIGNDFSVEIDVQRGADGSCVWPAIGIKDPTGQLNSFDQSYYFKMLLEAVTYDNGKLRYITSSDHDEVPVGDPGHIDGLTGTARIEIVGDRLRAYWNGLLIAEGYDTNIVDRTPALICTSYTMIPGQPEDAYASGVRVYVADDASPGVPEPSALGLVCLALLPLTRRRR